MSRFFRLALPAIAAAVFVSSCEDHENKVYVLPNGTATTAESVADYSVSYSVSGSWSGRSATGQVSSKLRLSESNGSLSGTLQWPNDSRSVSGSRSGNTVILYIEGGDTWKLSFSGNKLSGTGYKKGGGTYACSFSR